MVSPLQVVEQLWLVELLEVNHIRNIVLPISQLLAILVGNRILFDSIALGLAIPHNHHNLFGKHLGNFGLQESILTDIR